MAPTGMEVTMDIRNYEEAVNILADAEHFIMVAVVKGENDERLWTMVSSDTVSHRTLLEYGIHRSEAWLNGMDESANRGGE